MPDEPTVAVCAAKYSDADLALSAHSQLGVVKLFQGKLASSLAHCETVLALHDERHHLGGVLDRKVLALVFSALDLWTLGWPSSSPSTTGSPRASTRGT